VVSILSHNSFTFAHDERSKYSSVVIFPNVALQMVKLEQPHKHRCLSRLKCPKEASANWKQASNRCARDLLAFRTNQAATSFFHTFLTLSISSSAGHRILLAKFQVRCLRNLEDGWIYLLRFTLYRNMDDGWIGRQK